MANKSQNTFKKKEREESKRRKKKAKETRKLERKDSKSDMEPTAGVEDPDLAGIVPGPQPLPEEFKN